MSHTTYHTTYEVLCLTYPALMTLEQVALETGLAERTLRNWLVMGRFPLPVVRLGKAVRVRTTDLAVWIDEGTSFVQQKRRRGRPKKSDQIQNDSLSGQNNAAH